MAMEVWRGGATASAWSGKGWGASIRYSSRGKDVRLQCKINSGGRGDGVTEVLFSVKHDSFDDLAQAMIDANPTAAIRAFGLALQTHSED